MKRRCFLHVGMPKAASSTIQLTFAHHRETLRENGLLYPVSFASGFRPQPNHRLLYPPPPGTDDAAWREPVAQLAEELDASGADTVLFSSEYLWAADNRAIAKIRALLAPLFDELSVIAYLRRQDRHAVSRRAQQIKMGLAVDLFSDPPYPGHLYFELLSAWEVSGFSIEARPFDRDRFSGGSIIADLLAILEREPLPLEQKEDRYNVSPSGQELRLFEALNRAADAKGMDEQAFRYAFVRALVGRFPGPAWRPSRDQARAYYSRFAESNARLSDRFNDGEPFFSDDFDDYPEQETPVPPIDSEALEALVAELWLEQWRENAELRARLRRKQ